MSGWNLKGGVLIVVLMITIILFITTLGLAPVITGSRNIVINDLNRNKIFYAAEGGAMSLLHNIQRLGVANFYTESSEGSVGNLEQITIDGINVQLTADYISSNRVWNLSSKASENGTSCTIHIDQLTPSTVFDNCLGFTGDMLGTSAFTGEVTESGNEVVRSDNTDHFVGKTYFGGRFHVSGTPWFQGKVTYAQHVNDQYDSRFEGPATATNWLRNSKYKKGILDKSSPDYYGMYDDGNNYTSDAMMEARYTKMFEKGSYQISDVPINFEKSSYSWSELTTNSSATTHLNKSNFQAGGNSNISVTFSVDISASDDTTRTVRIVGGGLDEIVDLEGIDVVTIDTNKNNQKVKVKGEIDSDITLAIDHGIVEIVDDIYYTGLESYKDLSQSDILEENGKVKEMRNELQDNPDKYGKFGLINYNGHVLIADTHFTNKEAKKDKALLLMGAIYAPNGQYGSKSTADAALLPNKGSFISGHNLQVLSVGAIISEQKAYFKHGGIGIAAHFNSDLRLERGYKPKGFPPSIRTETVNGTEYDYVDLSESVMEWSIEWN